LVEEAAERPEEGLVFEVGEEAVLEGASQESRSPSSPDWLASSMMTTSKRLGRSTGTVAKTWCMGMIQAGTALWQARRLVRASSR
jgi:hypothetical protein